MKPIGVATQNANKSGAVSQKARYLGKALLISGLFLFISCDKTDDMFIIDNIPPIFNDPPVEPPPPNIIYTDIEPDFNSENVEDFYELDLNRDGVVDFNLSSSSDVWEWLGINANTSGGIIAVTPWYTNIVPLEIDTEIFTPSRFFNGEYYAASGFITLGDCLGNEDRDACYYDWSGKNDKYLGLRIVINGQKHYGWARLSVTSSTQWVISDYAYNTTPNSPILAGQKE